MTDRGLADGGPPSTEGGPYMLNTERARQWLTRVVAINDGHDVPELDGDVLDDEVPDISSDWEAFDLLNESLVPTDLPQGAWRVGAVTGPAELFLSCDNDGDYRVQFRPPRASYWVASPYEEIRRLGDRDATGVDAAIAVLRDLVRGANLIASEIGLAREAQAEEPGTVVVPVRSRQCGHVSACAYIAAQGERLDVEADRYRVPRHRGRDLWAHLRGIRDDGRQAADMAIRVMQLGWRPAVAAGEWNGAGSDATSGAISAHDGQERT